MKIVAYRNNSEGLKCETWHMWVFRAVQDTMMLQQHQPPPHWRKLSNCFSGRPCFTHLCVQIGHVLSVLMLLKHLKRSKASDVDGIRASAEHDLDALVDPSERTFDQLDQLLHGALVSSTPFSKLGTLKMLEPTGASWSLQYLHTVRK